MSRGRLSFAAVGSPGDASTHSILSISPMASSNSWMSEDDEGVGTRTSRTLRTRRTRKDATGGGATAGTPTSLPGTSRRVESWRLWRHDALMQHQYETAAFVGETVLALTGDANDAFWLAHVYYGQGKYARAKAVLDRDDLVQRSSVCCYLSAKCLVEMKEWQAVAELLEARATGKGAKEDTRRHSGSGAGGDSGDGGIEIEASLCYLLGVAYSNLNKFDLAKASLLEALMIDVKCFNAFDRLVTDQLLTPREEYELLNETMDFSALGSEDAEFARVMYATRASKLGELGPKWAQQQQQDELVDRYGISESLEVLRSEAEILFTQGKYPKCLAVTRRILERDPFKYSVLPTHLACLHELRLNSELYVLAHELVDKSPEEPVAWLAVAIYYLCNNKVAEARRFFSKASVMDARFGPAWIGFAHTFAIEGEYDQAVSAYTTAGRLFPGSHLPNLYLGMQHMQLSNLVLADVYLSAAYDMCRVDPLLVNERGVVAFQMGDIATAITHFHTAIELLEANQADMRAMASTWTNLGHAYRKSDDRERAAQMFETSLDIVPTDANTLAALGLVRWLSGQRLAAIDIVHRALSYAPNDPIANELLAEILDEHSHDSESAVMLVGRHDPLFANTDQLIDSLEPGLLGDDGIIKI